MIRCETTDDEITIYFKDKLIFFQRPKRPAIELGVGTGKYRMDHGSFKIKDRLISRIPQRECAVTQNSAGRVILNYGKSLTVSFAVVDDRLEISFAVLDAEVNRFWLHLPANKHEHIYGCGEQYSVLDLRGRKVHIWVQEQGVGRGHDAITMLADLHSNSGGSWYTTYFAQPTFVSSNNYFCHVDSSSYAEFDFRKTDEHILHLWDVPPKIIIGATESAPEIIGALSRFLGRQPMLPDWTWDGVWLGIQGGTPVVKQKLASALDADVKVGAIWAQDWEGRRITSFGKQLIWNWMYDPELYPGLPEYIKELNSRGIKFMGYINCFLAIGTTDSEDGPIPQHFLYNEAKVKDYCVKDGVGKDYYVKITTFPAAIIDVTNAAAVEWIKGVIKKNMIDLGLHGWMADFGEHLPVDAVMKSGEPAQSVHNSYPALWAKANYEAVKEAGRLDDIAFFMRAGYTGSSRYASAIWAGDQLVNWSMNDGLATVIPAGISLGFCGVGFFHSDIGGYTTVAWIKRTKELFMRWTELAAFTPIMRTHEGNRPDANWQFNSDDETLAHFARMSRIFAYLKPYHQNAAREYAEKGLPPIRHPYIHYEKDTELHSIAYQYLYGRDLMVAPVYKKGKRIMKVYLPDDVWVHAWTGIEFSEGWHRVSAPVGSPPVFYRTKSQFAALFEGLQDIC